MKNKQIIVNVEGLTLEEKQRVNEALAKISNVSIYDPVDLAKVMYILAFTGARHRMSFYYHGNHKPTNTPQQVLEMAGMNTKPHPHLEAIKAFYEAAKVSDKPWEAIQFKHPSDEIWNDCLTSPSWTGVYEYRAKPKTRMIHGVEVPVFEFVPDLCEKYYSATPSAAEYFLSDTFTRRPHQIRLLDRGLAHPFTPQGKEAAIIHAKAMLGIANE